MDIREIEIDIREFEPLIIALPKPYKELLIKVASAKGVPLNTFVFNLFYDYFDRNKLLNEKMKYQERSIIASVGEAAWYFYNKGISSDLVERRADLEEDMKEAPEPTTPQMQKPLVTQKAPEPITEPQTPFTPHVEQAVEEPVTVEPITVKDTVEVTLQPAEEPKEETVFEVENSDTASAVAEERRSRFLDIAEKINLQRGLGKVEEVKALLNQLNLPANNNQDIIQSSRLVSDILFAYKEEPVAYSYVIDALDQNEITIQEAHSIVLKAQQEREATTFKEPSVVDVPQSDEQPFQSFTALFEEEEQQPSSEEAREFVEQPYTGPAEVLEGSSVEPTLIEPETEMVVETDTEQEQSKQALNQDAENQETENNMDQQVFDSLQKILENLRLNKTDL